MTALFLATCDCELQLHGEAVLTKPENGANILVANASSSDKPSEAEEITRFLLEAFADYEDQVPPLALGFKTFRNLTFDDDGAPLVDVNPLEIFVSGAFLTEHDEQFHFDFPGSELPD